MTLTTVTLLSTPLLAQDPNDAQEIREARKAKRAWPAARSITSINLLHLTDENVGLALSYERFLNNNSIVSLYLPISFALPQNDWGTNEDPVIYDGYNVYYTPPRTETQHRGTGMAYFYPGVKIYPGGAHKKVSYALGASLVLGVGSVEVTKRTYTVDSFYQGGMRYYRRSMTDKQQHNETQIKTGFMVTNFLNLRPTNKLYLGVELGVGYSYLHVRDGQGVPRGALAQAGLKIGYVH